MKSEIKKRLEQELHEVDKGIKKLKMSIQEQKVSKRPNKCIVCEKQRGLVMGDKLEKLITSHKVVEMKRTVTMNIATKMTPRDTQENIK